jgi:hypothetical protein
MKLKIIQAGWANYTGMLCGAQFNEGVCDEATKRQAAQIANIIQVETDEGKNPSDTQAVIDSQTTAMSIPEPVAPPPAAPKITTIYSKEELEKIADEKGIDGLRAVAPEGVKSKSIVKLIQAILDAQNAAKEQAKAAALEQPTTNEAPAPAAEQPEVLIGSNHLPAEVDLGTGKSVQLGVIVAAAQKHSGLSVAEWNDRPQDVRDTHINDALEQMTKDAAERGHQVG